MVGVAQLVERRIVVPDAVGSSPISHPIKLMNALAAGTLPLRQALSRACAVFPFSAAEASAAGKPGWWDVV